MESIAMPILIYKAITFELTQYLNSNKSKSKSKGDIFIYKTIILGKKSNKKPV